LVKYTTYLTNDLITKIKIKAALTRKKSYQIIQQALEEFLEHLYFTQFGGLHKLFYTLLNLFVIFILILRTS